MEGFGRNAGQPISLHSCKEPHFINNSTMNSLVYTQQIAPEELERLINDELRIHGNQQGTLRLRDAFSSEYEKNLMHFFPLTQDKRTYFLVYHINRPEALFGINFRSSEKSCHANISSFARIIDKDSTSLAGWQYLEAIIETDLLPRGGEIIVSLLMTKGSVNAFMAMGNRCEQCNKNYSIALTPENRNPWRTALVIRHDLTN